MTPSIIKEKIQNLEIYLEVCKDDFLKAYTNGRIKALKSKNPKSKKLMKEALMFSSVNTNDDIQAFWKGFLNGLQFINN